MSADYDRGWNAALEAARNKLRTRDDLSVVRLTSIIQVFSDDLAALKRPETPPEEGPDLSRAPCAWDGCGLPQESHHMGADHSWRAAAPEEKAPEPRCTETLKTSGEACDYPLPCPYHPRGPIDSGRPPPERTVQTVCAYCYRAVGHFEDCPSMQPPSKLQAESAAHPEPKTEPACVVCGKSEGWHRAGTPHRFNEVKP